MAWRPVLMIAFLVGAAAGVSMLVGLKSVSQDPPAQVEEAAAPELFDHMLEVKALVRDLSRLAGDATKKSEALPLITELEGHIIAAKEMVPPAAEVKPEAERPAFVLSFRKAMTELLREVAELELDIIEDRNDQAVERITTTLIQMRDKAHEVFQEDE
jgi:hypothetical protein